MLSPIQYIPPFLWLHLDMEILFLQLQVIFKGMLFRGED